MMSTGKDQLETISISNKDGFIFTPKQNWSDYDLQTNNVSFNGIDTGLQAIVYKGNFVAFRSKNYHVFPHEDIFVTLDPVMDAINGEPLHERIQQKDRLQIVYGKNKSMEVEANYKIHGGKKTFYGTKVRTEYIFKDEKFDVTGDGDIVQFGASLSNTLDGTGSLSISPFSWRQTCQNGMGHYATAVQISEHIIQQMMLKKEGLGDVQGLSNHIKTIMDESKSFDDLMQKIKKERMSHHTKIPVEWISNRVYLLKESAALYKQRYRQMTEIVVSQKQAELIAKHMPKRLVETLDWLKVSDEFVEEKDATGQPIKRLVQNVTMSTVPTQWKAFNDVTDNLTHVQRAFDSKTKHYTELDKILVMV